MSDDGTGRGATLREAPSQIFLILATVAFSAMAIFVVASAAARYIAGAPFHFTEELVGLLFLIGTFLTFPHAATSRDQIRMTLFVEMLPRRAGMFSGLFSSLIVSIFSGWFCYALGKYAYTAFQFNTRTEQAEILIWPWMLLLVVLIASGGLIALVNFVHLASGRRADDPDNRNNEAPTP
ncbi:TRAP transporter small permease [Oceanibacterium hippocampi]|uniref:TRAP transporter small permease protein n=1 Tax=Oceanibacterium hippocampi TaxID=745714 RepID=A0A1Y5U0F7_9PROT|nr:TRAP transporter small permease [Oceanibacterium hippocampi]SLN75538.1 Tripartite ATP-independent periplasmic transporters, DctQ component [Oceanibacterium hippocampi]